VIGASVLAFVITLAVVVPSAGDRARRAASTAKEQGARRKMPPLLTAEELALGSEDFILPSLDLPTDGMHYAPFRPRITRWSADLAAKYWVSPRDIAAEIIQSVNDQNMQRLFQDIP